jgi:DNA-binding IclR family transcriptional regulator
MALQTLISVTPPQISGKRLPAIDRAFDLLELLADKCGSLSLSEISRTLHIPKSSAHYLVHTLVTRGYLQLTPNGRNYSSGSRLTVILGDQSVGRHQLRKICAPYLRKLATTFGLTAHAAVLEDSEGTIIDKQECTTNREPGLNLARHFDLHCTALGKALIVELSEGELEKLFQNRGFPRHNTKTIFSLDALKSDLEKVKAKGFAVNDEEHTVGVRAIAAPVPNHLGQVIAAISLHGPIVSIPNSRIASVGSQICSVARDISEHF